MTPREIFKNARFILNDTDPVAYRNSDPELLGYLNNALAECSIIAPQLFWTTGDMECAPDKTEQGVTFADAQALVEVVRVKDGRAVTYCDRASLSAFNPDWGNDPAGTAVHWMKNPADPLRYYIYPKAPAAQVLEVTYVRNPEPITSLDQEITDVPPSVAPALESYVVFGAESKDDEHVNSGRAAGMYQKFVALLKPA